ncbi:MAG: Translation initiation factor IF-3 [candidate division WS2 bacterium]|uniref:Translation initiation factor IF-3 n=1 Tax=Psychracetigena formicireducens TaxID=2986056 RepID=A0A9E2BF19_PSYF1|nr:Translation initiation factor IF-3 [Candidatus Psychracetigena formicireducens]MBT9144317.1 Translation initiation factor IF-3 [Candidatus Psychracetigena formicireducens]
MRYISKGIGLNESIKAQAVRLIDENGQQVGILTTREAIEIARQRGLDLLEVSPNSDPPVCKILDYGRYRYELHKKEKEAKKKQKVIEVKEIRFRNFNINNHDIEVKLRHIEGFLSDGDKVKISLMLRGRALAHVDLGFALFNKIALKLQDKCILERTPQIDGKRLVMVLSPKSQRS